MSAQFVDFCPASLIVCLYLDEAVVAELLRRFRGHIEIVDVSEKLPGYFFLLVCQS